MSTYTRQPRRARTSVRPLPRGATAAAIVCVGVLATLALTAATSRAQGAEQPPAGAVLVLVAQSDCLTWLPVGQAVVPPVACDPGGAP